MKNICVIALKLTQDLIDLDCDYIGVETVPYFLMTIIKNKIYYW